jgi:DNA-binding XRE family transcriptional regulator
MKKVKKTDKFIELRAEGLSYADIAKKLDVSKQTLITWSKEFKLEIKNAKAINFDALFRKYTVAKEKRIEVFGERLENVLAELDKRDLSKVPTEKLFKIAFDLSDRLKDEAEPLQLREKTGKTRSIFDVDLDVEQIDSWEI